MGPSKQLFPLTALAICSLGLTPAPAVRATTPNIWRYTVEELSDHALQITADFGVKPPGRLHVGSATESFVSRVEAATPQGFAAVAMGPDKTWLVDKCGHEGCKLRYRFDLDAAAKALDNRTSAALDHAAYVSTLDVWLLHPEGEQASSLQRVDISVKPLAGNAFGLGLPLASEGSSNVYTTNAEDLQALAPGVLGPLHSHRWQETGGSIDLEIAPELFSQETAIVTWVKKAAAAVASYYGRLPTPHVLVYIAAPMDEGGGGVTYGSGGATILIPLTAQQVAKGMNNDWVVAHELVHTAMPNLEANHHWLEEGIATYVEPIARLRVGQLNAAGVFTDMIKGLPNGMPQLGDKGLDNTDTWGRTYWGGALFCFLADVTLRERSHGRIGLETALRGIVAKGGSVAVDWPIADVIRVGDEATGYPVLRELYAKMKDRPWAPELNKLFTSLGIVYDHGKVTFNDKAPLAYVRQGIITGKPVPAAN